MDLPKEIKRLPPIIPTLQRARDDLASTTGKLLAAFKASSSEARDYLEIKGEPDESFFSHHVRYLVRVALRKDGIEAEEECEFEQTPNTGLCIAHPRYLIRILRDTHSGSLPPAGESDRRKKFFAQESEQYRLFEPGEEVDGAEREPAHLLILWTTDQFRHFVGLWFICPNGEKGAPHFQQWMPLPDLGSLALGEMSVPPDLIPAKDLGFTRKDDRPEQEASKTGTETNE